MAQAQPRPPQIFAEVQITLSKEYAEELECPRTLVFNQAAYAAGPFEVQIAQNDLNTIFPREAVRKAVLVSSCVETVGLATA